VPAPRARHAWAVERRAEAPRLTGR